MGEYKHKAESVDNKIIKPQREEDQRLDTKPTEALTRVSANVAKPSDILTLQKSIGNRAVSNMIQRHSRSSMDTLNFWTQERESGREAWLNE